MDASDDPVGARDSDTPRMVPMSRRDDLLTLLATRSAKRGSFTLASGRQSSLYVDARVTSMSPEGLSLIGPLGLEAIRERDWPADSVGGLTLGADPIACAISYASANDARPVRAFTVRKEPKTHGTGKLIEGPFRAGDRVVVIEDTITTGASARKAVEAVRAAGGTVLGILALVDREEGGREALEADGLAVVSLTGASEIVPRIPA
jgi:orotate phosphoribosyltransferase